MLFPTETDVTVATVDVLTDALLGDHALAFRKHLETLLASGHKQVVIDLSAVYRIDSLALGALVAVHKQTRGRLTLRGVTISVTRVLKLTRLDRVITQEMRPTWYRQVA
ncbi:MAG: STAS domain-containing protein [Bacteroidota bacterium]